MSDEQAAGAGVDETGKAGGGAGGTEEQKSGGDGGQSLLSQAIDKSAGAGDEAGDKAGDVKEGDKPKEGEDKDGKPKEGEAEKGAQPLTSADFADQIPEGKVWDEELGKSYLDIVNEAKIPREAANQLLALYSGQQDRMLAAEQAAQAAAREKYLAEIAGWEKAAKADKEYGGQKWDAAQAVIARGSLKLATPEAKAVLEEYHLASHPEVLRMYYRAGLLLGEDGGLLAGAGAAGRKSDEEVFYSSATKG
jgi:hypothetical protein